MIDIGFAKAIDDRRWRSDDTRLGDWRTKSGITATCGDSAFRLVGQRKSANGSSSSSTSSYTVHTESHKRHATLSVFIAHPVFSVALMSYLPVSLSVTHWPPTGNARDT